MTELTRAPYSGVLIGAKIKFFRSRPQAPIVMSADVHFSISESEIVVTVWATTAEEDPGEILAFLVEGKDHSHASIELLVSVNSFSSSPAGITIIGSSQELRMSAMKDVVDDRPDICQMTLPAGLAYPFSSQKHEIVCCGQIQISQRKSFSGFWGECQELFLYIEDQPRFSIARLIPKTKKLAEQAWDAAEEALEYVLGVPFTPFYSSINIGQQLRVLIRPSKEPPYMLQGGSPIKEIRTDGQDFMAAFRNFFLYASQSDSERRRSRLHQVVNDVYSTFSGVITVQILHLAIAIEALAKMFSADHSEESFTQPERRAISRLIKRCSLSNKKKHRLHGILSNLTEPSMSMRFAHLLEEGVLLPQHVDAWNGYRHRSAHGAIGNETLSELALSRDILLNAFHRLIRHYLKTHLRGEAFRM